MCGPWTCIAYFHFLPSRLSAYWKFPFEWITFFRVSINLLSSVDSFQWPTPMDNVMQVVNRAEQRLQQQKNTHIGYFTTKVLTWIYELSLIYLFSYCSTEAWTNKININDTFMTSNKMCAWVNAHVYVCTFAAALCWLAHQKPSILS